MKSILKLSPLFLLCAQLLLVLAGLDSALAEGAAIKRSSPIIREIQYRFVIRNTTNHALNDVEFWTYGPAGITSAQKCLKLEASQPYRVILDDLGNQILHFRFPSLPPYAVRPISIRAIVELTDTPNPADSENAGQFLSPAQYIESDDPELRQFAERFASNSTRETAEKIFRWVSDHIVYSGYLRDNRGALYAFRNRRGDCTEYMFLFATLCRANGIPARGVSGHVCRENGILEPETYHNWAEFYDEGVWKLADPQRRVFAQNGSQYVAMRIIGSSPNPMGTSHRYRCNTGDVEVTMTSKTNPQGTQP